MSKSLNRVKAALATAGLQHTLLETGPARTAEMAANQVGCQVNQIGKSILLSGTETGDTYLFLTAGGNSVNLAKAATLANGPPNARQHNRSACRQGLQSVAYHPSAM